jgi:hypothetical protein
MTEVFTDWKTSSRSGGNNQCVEWGTTDAQRAVRDSKAPYGPMLIFLVGAFAALIACIRRGDYDV